MELPLVEVRRYSKSLDYDAIVTFEAYTKEAQEALERKLNTAKDDFMLYEAIRKGESFLVKPEKVSISWKYNNIILSTDSRVFILPLDDELVELFTDKEAGSYYFELKVNKVIPKGEKKAYFMSDIEAVYQAEYDYDTAKELLKQFKPWELLCYAVGYKADIKHFATRFALFSSLFTLNDQAIHTVTFTNPRTGKSRCAKMLMGLAKAYVTPFPTPAKLIYDSRKFSYGLCYFYDHLYIDEFDKVYSSRRRDSFKDSYEVLLDGMANGIWQRETTSKDYVNLVNFCFMGNIEQDSLNSYDLTAYSSNSRDRLREYVAQIGVNPEPFLDRIHYVEYIKDAPIAKAMLNYSESNNVLFLKPSVSRSIIKLLQDQCLTKDIARRASSLIDDFFNAIKAVIETLQIEGLDDYTIEKLVKGELSLYDIVKGDKLIEKENQAEDVKVEEFDMTVYLEGDKDGVERA